MLALNYLGRLGRLANQMFQIAAGYAHAKNIDDEFIIDYNITHHGGQGHPHLKYKDLF